MRILKLCYCGCGLPPKTKGCRWRVGHQNRRTDEEFSRAFWSKVDSSGGPNACWPWLASVDPEGYGFCCRYGKTVRAHRVAWELEHGLLSLAEVVRHTCDNPPCCNPTHLLKGTVYDNVADRVLRNRQNKGEFVNTSKMDPSKILRLRRLRQEKRFTLSFLGKLFGLSISAVSSIVRRKSWKHL